MPRRISPLSLPGPAPLACALALLAACAPAPPPPPPAAVLLLQPPPPVAPPPQAAPPVDPAAPLSLPAPALPPAPWLEPPARGKIARYPLDERDEVAVGLRLGVIRTKAGHYIVHDELGVIGPLSLPAGTTWVGVAGADDAIYAADGEGRLHRAADARAAARPGGFEVRGQAPGATAWDAAASLIAAAAGAQVLVSADEGRTFQAAKVAPGVTVRAVLVRGDGVLAAVADAPARGARGGKAAPPRTFLSRDKGRTFQTSAFQPLKVVREGAWIWNDEWACPAVLSRDGKQWTKKADPDEVFQKRSRFSSDLWLLEALRPSVKDPRVTAADPPAPEPPPPGGAAVGAEEPCLAKGMGGLVGGLMGTSLEGCRGATCLLNGHGPFPPAPRTRIQMFDDAVCDPRTASADGSCQPDAPLLRAPTFAVIDQETGAVATAPAPPGCAAPSSIWSAAGIAVLVCYAPQDQASLFVRDAAGPWRAEATLPLPPSRLAHLAAAPDGTLVLEEQAPIEALPGAGLGARGGVRKGPLRALVRSPRPLGDAQAWRSIVAPEGVAIRPAPGGAALVVSSPATSAGARLDVHLDLPGQGPQPLARGVEAPMNLLHIEVRDGQIRAEGHAKLTRMPWLGPKDTPEKKGIVRLVLTNGGTLAPVLAPAGEAGSGGRP